MSNHRRRVRGVCIGAALLAVLSACSSGGSDTSVVDASVTLAGFADGACSGTFVAHDLDHTTRPRGTAAAMTDGTGAGVLLDDIDGDGRTDIVLPDLTGETSVLWNEGDLSFERMALASGRFRQAVSFDVDADGALDLVLSSGLGPAQVYLADGPRSFARTEVRDIGLMAFSLAPGDLDGDGRVGLVASSYNAELTANRDLRVLAGVNVGTAVYRPLDAANLSYEEEVLETSAQALVSQIVDVDGDGREDVVAGNDLGTPDRIWLGTDTGLELTDLFVTTTLSTMSIDVGDVDNDGDRDLVATDMAPMAGEDPEPWLALADDMAAAMVDDVQQPVNALQLRGEGDAYTDVAADFGVDATGWSWSGILGDLDHDGRQDLYVVNGMQAEGIFDTLPNAELVEPNQAFRGAATGFEPMPGWGLDDLAGGRGMAQADLDGDGDLDIVINNLGVPSRLFENQLCGGSSITVDLAWAGVQNIAALGASVIVDDGTTEHLRIVTGSRGYLSTSATGAHVGLADGSSTVDITVRWPDGATSTIDDVEPDTHVVIERTAAPVAATNRVETP